MEMRQGRLWMLADVYDSGDCVKKSVVVLPSSVSASRRAPRVPPCFLREKGPRPPSEEAPGFIRRGSSTRVARQSSHTPC